MENREQRTNRRDFLTQILGVWSVLLAVPVVKAVVEYITPIRRSDTQREIIRVASTDDLAPNTAKIFKVNKEPVIVVHTKAGQYKAFNARCTHLGCVVQYMREAERPYFGCNCHGSEFDINGKNIGGPAPRPLVAYRVIIKESSVLVAKA